MRPAELRESLFEKSGPRPEPEDHTHLCLDCGSLESSSCSACDEAESYFLPPAILSALGEPADEMETEREDVLRGLLAVGLATIERGGMSTHTRAVVFLRDLEEAEAAASDAPEKAGPLGLVDAAPRQAVKPT